MEAKLAGPHGVGRLAECMTTDSFALGLVRRWRGLAKARFGQELPEASDFHENCLLAGRLLHDPVVGKWVASAYPIIVVDELQDSKAGQVEMFHALAQVADCFVAADEFQDLSGTEDCEAVNWARSSGITEQLSVIHRTAVSGLLTASSALRSGGGIAAGTGFSLLPAPNHNVGASYVANSLKWWWNDSAEIAIISPTGPKRSTFIRRLFERLEKPFVNEKTKVMSGPFTVPWEVSNDAADQAVAGGLGLPSDDGAIVAAASIIPYAETALPELKLWLDHQRRVAGRTEFQVAEILRQSSRLLAMRRMFLRGHARKVRAMTVDQAKNREFDSVIVLWPVEIGGSSEVQRRRLYNAITRARLRAVVIVQDPKPKDSRLATPPFSGA